MDEFEKSRWMRTLDYARVLPQYLYPQHLLSRLVLHITCIRYRPFKNWLIGWFVHRYGVDLREAKHRNISDYPDFNSFFTRPLRQGARPLAIDPGALLSPADGEISQIGRIVDGSLIQAKGLSYSLGRLLGEQRTWSERFRDGSFITIYLAPRDYHRVHMPLAGQLREMLYIPGRLFSVNPLTSRVVPALFTKNERVIAYFDQKAGPFALVLVGALLVGSVETAWAGRVTPACRRPQIWRYQDGNTPPIILERGAEVGRFNMGSTVIALFAESVVGWDTRLSPGQRIVAGETIGQLLQPAVAPAHGAKTASSTASRDVASSRTPS